MIKVTWHKNSLAIQGHANCKTRGKDLVCCAVSAIIQTATAWFDKDDIEIIDDEQIPIFIIKLIKKNKLNQKYLELIYRQLACLAKHNKKYMSCKKQNNER